jgi:hypothetical protein
VEVLNQEIPIDAEGGMLFDHALQTLRDHRFA